MSDLLSWRARSNILTPSASALLQSCERGVEDVGQPLLIAGRENMARLVAAMTREWEVATHNVTLAAQQVCFTSFLLSLFGAVSAAVSFLVPVLSGCLGLPRRSVQRPSLCVHRRVLNSNEAALQASFSFCSCGKLRLGGMLCIALALCHGKMLPLAATRSQDVF